MKPIFHKKFQKFIKKLKDKLLLDKVKLEINLIIEDPQKGKILEHPFRKYQIRSLSFIFKKNSYRIAYTQDKINKKLIFLVIDSRENFYEKLKTII